jgi:hypothetical protein
MNAMYIEMRRGYTPKGDIEKITFVPFLSSFLEKLQI